MLKVNLTVVKTDNIINTKDKKPIPIWRNEHVVFPKTIDVNFDRLKNSTPPILLNKLFLFKLICLVLSFLIQIYG